jgi:hypothetical protein
MICEELAKPKQTGDWTKLLCMSTFAEEESPASVQGKSQRSRVALVSMTVARFILGLGMVPYGIDKLLDYQFKVAAWSYAQPLGLIDGKTLTWAMLGFSPRFQMLLGASELIPALLLLNARTRRLGALLMFPVLLNVVLINFFFDLWPGTKIVSSFLLALNAFLLFYDLPLYVDFFKRLLVPPVPIASRRLRVTAKISGFVISTMTIVVFVCFLIWGIVRLNTPISDFIGVRSINSAGTWKVESLSIAGLPVTIAPGTSFFFNPFNTCVYGDVTHPHFGTFEADKFHQTFKIDKVLLEGSASTITGAYEVQGDRLLLNGRRDNQPILLTLQRDRWGIPR